MNTKDFVSPSSFGLAVLKREGEAIKYDESAVDETERAAETFYLERAFTKEQFALLADLLATSPEAFIKELAEECRDMSLNGYGGGA